MENYRSIRIPAGVRWIRIAENQAAGWQYRLGPDADWMAVPRAPDASMLFENTAPESPTQIEMRYAPPMRRLGFVISGCSLLLILLIGLMKSTALKRLGRFSEAPGQMN